MLGLEPLDELAAWTLARDGELTAERRV
jgi:hypothetical protein